MKYYYTCSSEPLMYSTCGNLMSKDGFLHHRRRFDYHVLIFVLEGTLNITQSEVSHAVAPGQYIVLKSGEEHYGHQPSTGRLAYLWVHFASGTPWETGRYGSSLKLPEAYSYLIPEHGISGSLQRISMLFHQLIDFSRQETRYTEAILNYAMSLLAMEITQQFLDGLYNRNHNISPTIYTVMEWIKSNCHKPLTLPEIAGEFHYNPEYLSSLFKKETGMKLIFFLNKSRIEISKNLLSSNNITIKEAAYSCGFQDEKYYMKLFKTYEGMTPLQVRSRCP
ncbi:AraC family transcriptional regulator [Paenibacillus sp. MMS20-IR301]|uniref:helix-turn-helix transcriptional regulator n=1 Tax=Paenibacillus sp. MMS20-IR301 TaxID=2895946 RepID=UPI0028EC1A2D|nr:AraC family transcriptional regulator [Paenibacillus sp. MMS20-IR301]WNS45216.1 AraC family transcriptional regulator [Paenibacillus sp. MMS20-IR301]